MQVTIIGSGNIATVLGRLFIQKGHQIQQVYSRNAVNAGTLAKQLQAEAVSDLIKLDTKADLYLLAVTDDALPGIAAQLSLGDALVLHTAGSVSKEVLSTVSTNYGVLWPMKMIRKPMTTLEPVTVLIDGSSEQVIHEIEKIALLFSPVIARADDNMRAKMHMLAAITSNFTNHLYHLAADYCVAESIDFRFFYPVIEETAQRIQTQHPQELQAGPAFRGDSQTLNKHRQLLAQYPQLAKLYQALSESIAESVTNISQRE